MQCSYGTLDCHPPGSDLPVPQVLYRVSRRGEGVKLHHVRGSKVKNRAFTPLVEHPSFIHSPYPEPLCMPKNCECPTLGVWCG